MFIFTSNVTLPWTVSLDNSKISGLVFLSPFWTMLLTSWPFSKFSMTKSATSRCRLKWMLPAIFMSSSIMAAAATKSSRKMPATTSNVMSPREPMTSPSATTYDVNWTLVQKKNHEFKLTQHFIAPLFTGKRLRFVQNGNVLRNIKIVECLLHLQVSTNNQLFKSLKKSGQNRNFKFIFICTNLGAKKYEIAFLFDNVCTYSACRVTPLMSR